MRMEEDFSGDKIELTNICRNLKRMLNVYSKKIILEINKENKGNQDFVLVGLLSLYVISNNLLNSVFYHRQKNDYYSANIHLRTVFETPIVYIRIYRKNKLQEYYKNTLNKEDLKDYRNITTAMESYAKYAKLSDSDKKILIEKYEDMCKFSHLNRLQGGQYKNHMNSFNLNLMIEKTYDSGFDKQTVSGIILSIEQLVNVIEIVCSKKTNYDKKIFDNIFKIIDNNRKKFTSLN